MWKAPHQAAASHQADTPDIPIPFHKSRRSRHRSAPPRLRWQRSLRAASAIASSSGSIAAPQDIHCRHPRKSPHGSAQTAMIRCAPSHRHSVPAPRSTQGSQPPHGWFAYRRVRFAAALSVPSLSESGNTDPFQRRLRSLFRPARAESDRAAQAAADNHPPLCSRKAPLPA